MKCNWLKWLIIAVKEKLKLKDTETLAERIVKPFVDGPQKLSVLRYRQRRRCQRSML